MPIIPGPESSSFLDSDVAQLRAMTNDPPSSDQSYSDEEYGTALVRLGGSLNRTAAYFWGLKAARYAELTDISEVGSSRSQSRLYQQALDMQKFYTAQAELENTGGVVAPKRTRIGRIVRSKVDSK